MFSHLRFATISISAFGLIVMAMMLVLLYSSPAQLVDRLQGFAVAQVENFAEEKVGAIAGEDNNSLLGRLSTQLNIERLVQIDDTKMFYDKFVRYVLSERCQQTDGDCARGVLFGSAILTEQLNRISNLKIGQNTIGDLVAERYDQTINGLMADLRLFAWANAIAFALIIGVSYLHKKHPTRLFTIAALMSIFVFAAIYWYVAKQDWVSSILFQNWMAGMYIAALCFVTFELFDLMFLGGRITDAVINGMTSLISS